MERVPEEIAGVWRKNERQRRKIVKGTMDQHGGRALLDELKEAILTNPVLKRPVPSQQFYLKTDWSTDAQGAVLLQAGHSEEEEAALMREVEGGAPRT